MQESGLEFLAVASANQTAMGTGTITGLSWCISNSSNWVYLSAAVRSLLRNKHVKQLWITVSHFGDCLIVVTSPSRSRGARINLRVP